MSFAIMQKTLEPPSRDALAAAFKALPTLTDLDAATLSRSAYGIITRRLSGSEAELLCRALAGQGVDVCMVEEEQLTPLPPAVRYRRIDCLPSHLVLHDPIGREASIAWQRIKLAAAGEVVMDKRQRIENQRIVRRRPTGRYGISQAHVETDVSYRYRREPALFLELLMDIEPWRVQAQGDKMLYAYLIGRLRPHWADNFNLVIGDLYHYARDSVRNRGLERFGRHGPPLMQYPSRHTFDEEITWLFWRYFKG